MSFQLTTTYTYKQLHHISGHHCLEIKFKVKNEAVSSNLYSCLLYMMHGYICIKGIINSFIVDLRGSDVVSVACFGVRVSVMFTLCLFIILLVQFGLLNGHLLKNSCPLGWQFVLNIFCLFVIFIYFPFRF